jgi:hypothetical protein
MNKQEFFAELRSKLNNVYETASDEFFADIEAHFQEGAAQGLSEEEICRNLGQPGNIAEQFLEEYQEPASKHEQETPVHKNMHDINIDKSFTGVQDIKIKLDFNQLTVKPALQGDSYRVTIQGRSRNNNYVVENNNGELNIIEETPLFRFDFFKTKPKLETVLWVPPSFMGKMKIKTNAGDVNMNGKFYRKARDSLNQEAKQK